MAIRRTPQCINKNSIAHVYFVLTKTLSVCFYPQVEKRSHFNHMMTVSVVRDHLFWFNNSSSNLGRSQTFSFISQEILISRRF